MLEELIKIKMEAEEILNEVGGTDRREKKETVD